MFRDILKIIIFLLFKNNNYYIFFSESNFTHNFLEKYFLKKIKKKILVFSFHKINKRNKNINYLYLNNNFARELFFTFCKCKFFYTTTPDIGFFIFRKSINKKIKYIYLQHSMFSLNAIYNDNSFINFDAVQCISKMQIEEIKEINNLNKTKIKSFKSKYLFPHKNHNIDHKFEILIAPTWYTNFYRQECFVKLIDLLNKHKITFKIRRHNMSIKNNELDDKLIKKYNFDFYENEVVNFKDFNYLISDWSGIIIEYYLIKKKKSFVIDLKQKIRNRNFFYSKKIPTEIMYRNTFSNNYDVDKIEDMILDIMSNKKNEIKKLYSFFGY